MIDDDTPWRLAVVDALVRLAPSGLPAPARVLELGTCPGGGSAVGLADAYGSCVSISTGSRVTAAARHAAPAQAHVTYHRRYPLLAGAPQHGPYDLVVGWHFERHLPRALLRQAPHGLIVSPMFLDQPRSRMTHVILRVSALTARLVVPRRWVDPPTRWDTIAGTVVRYPDAIGVACGCPACDPPHPLNRATRKATALYIQSVQAIQNRLTP